MIGFLFSNSTTAIAMATPQRMTLGLMGGMGPQATVDFLSRLIEATPGDLDQDHLRVLVDHDPTIPSRLESIAGTGIDVTPRLTAMAQRLEIAGAEFLAMSCNTAHAYQVFIQSAVSIPFVSIVDTTIENLNEEYPGRAVGLLATEGALAADLYQSKLITSGHELVVPEGKALDKLMHAIFEIKAGDLGVDVVQAILSVTNDLIFSGADLIVSACTELSLVLEPDAVSVPLIDPTDLLVKKCVDIGMGTITAPAPNPL